MTGLIHDPVIRRPFRCKWEFAQAMRIFLTDGICGGFTTFSTFSLDTYHLIERGQTLPSFAYMMASLMPSVGALIVALRFVRAVS